MSNEPCEIIPGQLDAQPCAQRDSFRELANYWRHMAYLLAGHDKQRISEADDAICGAFDAAGRDRIGPKMPKAGG